MGERDRLTAWALENLSENSPAWSQVMFARDHVASILSRKYEQYRNFWDVVGTHRSKSIILPVFHANLEKDGLRIWMRNNFHDWNISIDSDHPITCDFPDVFSDDNYHYCFCQGMEDHKFGTHTENNQKFTVSIADDYEVYTFFRAIRKHLGIEKE